MKRVTVLLTLMVVLAVSSLAYAEEDGPGTLSIGLHGIGSQWNYGRPMLRWRPSDSWAFDFTPTVRTSDGNDHSSSSGSSDMSNDSYGLNVGIVKIFRNIAGASVGWRVEVGYTYQSYSNSYDYSGTPYSYHDRTQLFDLGFGPDLEYFVPAVPGLSIGASAQIHYRYVSDTYASTSTTSFMSYSRSYREKNIDLLGELLTIRYYF